MVRIRWWLISVALFLFSCVLGLVIGPVSLNLSDIFVANTQSQLIFLEIRLPRVLLAATVGALLAASGAVTQGLFRNPLADPSLIGVTAGASAGASLAIVLTATAGATISVFNGGGIWLISIGAFAGGLIAVFFVYRLASKSGNTSVATMLLAGIAITALVSAITSTVEFFSANEVLRRISLWKMGALDGANYLRVGVALCVSAIFFALMPRFIQALNALLLGESEARHLGFAVEKLKRQLILLVAASVGVCVAVSGAIAFVGLVVPHFVRLIVGSNHKQVLPMSAVVGATLLVLSDIVARTLVSPAELPIGVVTAALGAPFFISLLSQRFHYGMKPA